MGAKGETSAEKLRFLFTEKGFMLDVQEEITSEELQGWKQRFETSRHQALYDLGFEEKPGWLDAAGGLRSCGRCSRKDHRISGNSVSLSGR